MKRMELRMELRTAAIAAAALVVGAAAGMAASEALHAQQGIKRIPLQRVELSDVPGKTAVMGIAEIQPGTAAGRHSHPGYEMGYMLEGTSIMQFDGEPPKEIKAGESYVIPSGTIHDARAVGDKPARVIAIYIVDTDKPLATPAAK